MFKLFSIPDRSIAPSGSCHKCDKTCWVEQAEPLVWSCFYCGNLAYYTYGTMRQQIDIRRSGPVDN